MASAITNTHLCVSKASNVLAFAWHDDIQKCLSPNNRAREDTLQNVKAKQCVAPRTMAIAFAMRKKKKKGPAPSV